MDFPRFNALFAPGTRSFRSAIAFTLTELLVTITIITILVAIAIPVATSLNRAGLQAKSVSRLRDLQRANIQYAGDHDQFYVSIWDPVINQPWFLNPEFLKYFASNPSSYWWGNSPENMQSPLVPLNIGQSMGASYGINADSMDWPPVPRHALRDVSAPSKMLAFAESQDWIVTEDGSHGQYKTPEAYSASTVAYRYNKMTNIVFFDGHVETLPQNKVAGDMVLWRRQE
jgi:prepilin-type processing-associated H-X9-DG protein/prepilin-type N-terminal cleavage/methylation domain-containing protein